MTDIKIYLNSPVQRHQLLTMADNEPLLAEAGRVYYEDYSLRPRNRPTDMAMCHLHEMVLFANLLSLQNGFTRCYYYDEELTIPITAENLSLSVYCDFKASGWRLPTVIEAKHYISKGWLRRIWLQCWSNDDPVCGVSFRAGDDRKGHVRESGLMEHFCLVRSVGS